MVGNSQDSGRQQTFPFVNILTQMNEEGGFQRSVLATGEGLPIAAVPDSMESESTGALVAMLQQVSQDIQSQLDLKGVNEVTIRDDDRFRLVCRGIAYQGDTLILAALVPPDQYYRRVTNRAIRRIRKQLD
jgi:predicted regulator of Ras-like GTPase activity (Roadblock/LC7/MglB family)